MGITIHIGIEDIKHLPEGHPVFELVEYASGAVALIEAHNCLGDPHIYRLDKRWRVTKDPLTAYPSIQCPRCGMHGWVTEGVWHDIVSGEATPIQLLREEGADERTART